MKNYKIRFPETFRDDVLKLVSASNDVVVNQLEPEAIFFTIQLEDEPADAMYETLCEHVASLVSRRDTLVNAQEQPSALYENRSELR